MTKTQVYAFDMFVETGLRIEFSFSVTIFTDIGDPFMNRVFVVVQSRDRFDRVVALIAVEPISKVNTQHMGSVEPLLTRLVPTVWTHEALLLQVSVQFVSAQIVL